ncbi:FRG domain-containing protein [Orbus sturtevantii]|uniref:FRG domain-containing protein n=1 Tax=Orbus sturtevantii TaxID=3074109 RepID=UPI00370D9883
MSDLDCEIMEISTISDLLTAIKSLRDLNGSHERFYRGLGDRQYIDFDCPSIYRKKTSEHEPYIKYEDKIFHDIIAKAPEDFSKCENTFECLVKMQHYGAPTRLLDVTSNPLVALYFSCVGVDGSVSFENDGAIVIYDIPQSNVKNFNSDTVTILSNISKIDNNYKPLYALLNKFAKDCKKIREFYKGICNDEEIKNYLDSYDDIKKSLEKEQNNKYREIFDNESNIDKEFLVGAREDYLDFKESSKKKTILKKMERIETTIQNNRPHSDIRFDHYIKQEKLFFVHDNINYKDLTSVFCVKPKLNNPRIINQNGAFLIFGFASLTDTKSSTVTQHFNYKALNSNSGKHLHIKIPKNKKEQLVNQLKLLGIDRAFIYPEIENISKVITEQYTIKSD